MFAVSVISDIDTGLALAIMDADFLASLRTGDCRCNFLRISCEKGVTTIAFIGAGHLASNMLDAHMEFGFPIESVRVWSRSASNREEFAKKASETIESSRSRRNRQRTP